MASSFFAVTLVKEAVPNLFNPQPKFQFNLVYDPA